MQAADHGFGWGAGKNGSGKAAAGKEGSFGKDQRMIVPSAAGGGPCAADRGILGGETLSGSQCRLALQSGREGLREGWSSARFARRLGDCPGGAEAVRADAAGGSGLLPLPCLAALLAPLAWWPRWPGGLWPGGLPGGLPDGS